MANSNNRILNNVDNVKGIVSTRNWITNNNADINTQGWITYADAAGPAPVDGTGGSPAVTWTRDTSVVYAGDGNFLFTKDAVNRQGQGASYQFTIDPTDRATVQQIKFDYIVRSGTFSVGTPTTDSDLTVWIYDTLNNQLIQPSTYKLFSNSSSVNGSFIANFQVPANTLDLRLIIHQSTTSSAAYTVAFNNFQVARTTYALGTTITDWTDFGPMVITGTGSNPTKGTVVRDEARYRRVGSSVEILWNYEQSAGGSAGSGTYLFALPPGLSADTSKITPTTSLEESSVGTSTTFISRAGVVKLYDSTHLAIVFVGATSAATEFVSGSAAALSNANAKYSFLASVPILGWQTQQQTSDINDQRIVGAAYWIGADCDGFGQPINFSNKIYDTHAAVTASPPGTGTWRFTAPISGLYSVHGTLSLLTGSNSGIAISKNGSIFTGQIGYITNNNGVGSFNSTIQLNAGDYIHIEVNQNVVLDGDAQMSSSNVGQIYIERVANPAQISSTETVAAAYWLSSNFVAGPTTPINFDSREIDTHGSVTTSPTAWRFTAPISGLYSVSGSSYRALGSGIKVFKNGSAYKAIGAAASTTNAVGTWTGILRLNAGDYIDIRPDSSDTVLGGALNADLTANVNIFRVGI